MCGICGKFSNYGVQVADLQKMAQAIAHRGPDDEGLYVKACMGLCSRRLSIIDLDHGHQPISNEDESCWIVYNGEIYNYRELRHELEGQGHSFRTHTDTEVIIHLYEELGERCVEKLRGMFAFAIWDERAQKLVLARDRMGQKPLFYAQEGSDFLFGSEIKAILAVSRQERELDYPSLHDYLSLRYLPAPQTMLRHVKKLPPAHILVYEQGTIRIERYWQLSFRNKFQLSEAEFLQGLQTHLTQAVESHLISDVPVGAFLSGGMDSSMVVALMAGQLAGDFKTFAIGVKEADFNEAPYARQVADHCHTHHIEQQVASNIIHLLPKMIWHMDEPSDPIAACHFHVAAVAARHVKVVLGGDGGDELFAGFDRYLGISRIGPYAMLPAFLRRRIVGPLLQAMPDSFTYKSIAQKARWVHQLALLPGVGERYAEATCFFRFTHQAKQALFSDKLWAQVGQRNSADVIVEHFAEADSDDLIDQMLYADYMTKLPEHTLMMTDRMTMAHSLELRSPLVDHELVEYLAAFPSHLKIRKGELKYALRRVGRAYLPPAILQRHKQGFMFPVAYWFRNELHGFLRAILLDSPFVQAGLFRRSYVQQLLDEHRRNQVDHHVRLWMLLNLVIWHQLYIEQAPVAAVTERLHTYVNADKRRFATVSTPVSQLQKM